MKKKIQSLNRRDGIQLQPDLEKDIQDIVNSSADSATATFLRGTFQRLFWEEQVKAYKTKSATGMRWHPVIVRWALHIKMLSSSAYHAFRSIPAEGPPLRWKKHFDISSTSLALNSEKNLLPAISRIFLTSLLALT